MFKSALHPTIHFQSHSTRVIPVRFPTFARKFKETQQSVETLSNYTQLPLGTNEPKLATERSKSKKLENSSAFPAVVTLERSRVI